MQIIKSNIEQAFDKLDVPFDREKVFADAAAFRRRLTEGARPVSGRKPGIAGRVHIEHSRERQFSNLYSQDQPVRGSVATRNRTTGAITYIGPFGLWLFARDTAQIHGIRRRHKVDGVLLNLAG